MAWDSKSVRTPFAARHPRQDFSKSHTTFSGQDIRVYAISPHKKAAIDLALLEKGASPEDLAKQHPHFYELQTIQTLSVSVFRETAPVRAIGFVGEKGRTRGTRTVAGSMVFAVFDRHPLLDIMAILSGDTARDVVSPQSEGSMAFSLIDQMPPLDILIFFANESGAAAEMALFGVEFASEGYVMSVNDLYSEMTVQFTARHKTLMRPGGYNETVRREAVRKKTFSSILSGNYSDNVKQLLSRSQYRMR